MFLASISLPLPGINAPVDPVGLFLKILVIGPIIGGFLLARESKGKVVLELIAVSLLVLATLIPVDVTAASMQNIIASFSSRWPLIFFLLGVAFVRDGGIKIVIGVILMALSGWVSIPHL